MNVAFRVDASKEIGIGHLMRCLALSEELIKRGNTCYFLSKIENYKLIKKIKKFNINFEEIKENITLKEEIGKLIEFSKNKNIDWIVTDNYQIDSNYTKKIKENGFYVLSIDDISQIHYHSDIVLNQNVGAEKLDFFLENYTRLLLGPKYTMIRDELLKREEKIYSENIKKILITLGGTDNENLTLEVLKSLSNIGRNIEFLTILGPFNRFSKQIKDYVEKESLNVKLIESPENMANVYLKSDMAISTGGSSCYELSYFGIPNLIVTIADNQLNIAQELDNKKISVYIGKAKDMKTEKIKYKVKELIDDCSLRKKMSRNGRKLIDGKGKQRIVDYMEQFH